MTIELASDNDANSETAEKTLESKAVSVLDTWAERHGVTFSKSKFGVAYKIDWAIEPLSKGQLLDLVQSALKETLV
jgi:hypothetical protein